MRAKTSWCCVSAPPEPVVLDVIRHDRSNLDLRTQNGHVRFRLRKLDMLFNRTQWLLTDSNTAESTPVVLRSKRLSKVVTFKDAKGGALARLTNGLFRSGSSFCWGSETYRWSSAPDKLMLINVNTDAVHAILSSCFTVSHGVAIKADSYCLATTMILNGCG